MYRIGWFAQKIGRSASTVRRWEREGRIHARRRTSVQRSFTDVNVRTVLQPGFDEAKRKTVVYCRVSSPAQKDDLAAQVAAMDAIERGEESLSPQQEMTEDLLTIVHTFSCRLGRLRRYEKTLKDKLSGQMTG